jgi:HSP20 family protein
MSNIIKKNENTMAEWNPLRSMRDLLRWDPFREMSPLWDRYEQQLQRDAWLPDFEVRETKDSYVFKADVPGVKKEDIDVSLSGNRLQVTGKREAEKETKEDTFYAYERSYGSFTRAFTLPADIDADHVRTELKDGVLTLTIPKKVEAQAKKIPIGTGSTKS